LISKLEESINFEEVIYEVSFGRIITHIGFRWKKTQSGRVLIEKEIIRSICVSYMTALGKCKANECPVMFKD
jgi:hypothetical protein